MIEREFIVQKTKEYYIKKYIESKLPKVGISSIQLKKIPLGEKIIIETSRPSLIVGSKGANIKDLTKALKRDFKLENPQIEINEVKNVFLDANIVAEKISSSLERFGIARFKGIGHKIMENVMNAGALGVEIILSGKIPSARAKSWRFYQGYLKKCGDIAIHGVKKAQTSALLKSGIIGIKVAIMPPEVVLPDDIDILEEPQQVVGGVTEKGSGENEGADKEDGKKSGKKKISTKKTSVSTKPTAKKPKLKVQKPKEIEDETKKIEGSAETPVSETEEEKPVVGEEPEISESISESKVTGGPAEDERENQ